MSGKVVLLLSAFVAATSSVGASNATNVGPFYLTADFKNAASIETLEKWERRGNRTRLQIRPFFPPDLNLPEEAYWCANSTSKLLPHYPYQAPQVLKELSRILKRKHREGATNRGINLIDSTPFLKTFCVI